ncbi:hypothetical protein ACIP10_36410 [Streptomyces galbus]|uniref:acyl-CoA dehydrogenase family protein n=1 Tax=Streptomyces galbus TaxID=33898 RepID=UPI0038120EE9
MTDVALITFDEVRTLPVLAARRHACCGRRDPYPAERQGRRLELTRRDPIRMAGGQVVLAAVSRAAASIVVRYASRRTTFDPRAGMGSVPVLAYRHQRRALPGALSTAYVLSTLAKSVTEQATHDLTPRLIRTQSLLKAKATCLTEGALERSRSACGAHGFVGDNCFTQYEVLARAFGCTAGDSPTASF